MFSSIFSSCCPEQQSFLSVVPTWPTHLRMADWPHWMLVLCLVTELLSGSCVLLRSLNVVVSCMHAGNCVRTTVCWSSRVSTATLSSMLLRSCFYSDEKADQVTVCNKGIYSNVCAGCCSAQRLIHMAAGNMCATHGEA